MSMKVSLLDFIDSEKLPKPSPENIAYKVVLDFEAEVFLKLKEKGLSQKDIAEILDISPSAISKMLTKGTNLTIKTMAKIAYALDCYLSPIELKEMDEKAFWEVIESESVSASISFASSYMSKSTHVTSGHIENTKISSNQTNLNKHHTRMPLDKLERIAA